MSYIPPELGYTDSDEWVRGQGWEITVGLTDYGQKHLGAVVDVVLPEVGVTLSAGDRCGAVKSAQAASDVFAPVDCMILAVNDALGGSPALVNSDPYGEGWLFRAVMSEPNQFYELYDAPDYEEAVG
jgi:glycine cleavage system H protein